MAFFRPSDANMLRTAWELSAGLLSFIVAIAIGWWFGRTLDGWLGTRPLFALVGAGLGGFGGFMSIYYRVKKDTERRDG